MNKLRLITGVFSFRALPVAAPQKATSKSMDESRPPETYRIPDAARIGHVHLKVSDLEKALKFYSGLLGFQVRQRYGREAVFLAAGNYHHHIGLNIWFSKGGLSAPKSSPGLFHTAICYPNRRELARIYHRLKEHKYPLTGAADHGVSEALYLDDPDGNGVELYWDTPFESWPKTDNGSLEMYTRPLDLEGLLAELDRV
jgi:catechol 2,3-dioxygenase